MTIRIRSTLCFWFVAWVLLAFGGACQHEESERLDSFVDEDAPDFASLADTGRTGWADGESSDIGSVPARRCKPPKGLSGSPSTIEEALALINALPKPTSVACLVESLDRPLMVDATRGTISAQPADGAQSPRIFILKRPFILSIVPSGFGREVVEFSVVTPSTWDSATPRSLKAELPFPVDEPLSKEAPYTKITYDEQMTACAFCHPAEQRVPEIAFTRAYVSGALKPVERERVPLESLRAEYEMCDRSEDAVRCDIYDALFDFGPVVQANFPEAWPTFY